MSVCIPYSQYLSNPDAFDLVSGPSSDCSSCGTGFTTSMGTNVTVDVFPQLGDKYGLSLTFSEVSKGGTTRVSELYGYEKFTPKEFDSNPDLQGRIALNGFYVNTDAEHSGEILVKVSLPDIGIPEFEFDQVGVVRISEGIAEDVTVRSGPNAPDYNTRTVCGIVPGFSIIVTDTWCWEGTVYCIPYPCEGDTGPFGWKNPCAGRCITLCPSGNEPGPDCTCSEMGRCCRGGACSETTRADCTGGSFSAGGKCNPAGKAACCPQIDKKGCTNGSCLKCGPGYREDLDNCECRCDPPKETCAGTGPTMQCLDKCPSGMTRNQFNCDCECINGVNCKREGADEEACFEYCGDRGRGPDCECKCPLGQTPTQRPFSCECVQQAEFGGAVVSSFTSCKECQTALETPKTTPGDQTANCGRWFNSSGDLQNPVWIWQSYTCEQRFIEVCA